MPLPDKEFVNPPVVIDPANLPRGYAITVEYLLSLRTYQYIWQIPKHQRPYSWSVNNNDEDPGEVEEFYLDIRKACTSDYVHSFGTIDTTLGETVSLKWKHQGPEENMDYTCIVVNDGQQRLTTIFLAYAAYCEIQNRLGENDYRDLISADPTIEIARSSFRLVHEDDPRVPHHRLQLQVDDLNTTLSGLVQNGDNYAFTAPPADIRLTDADTGRKRQGNSRPARRLIDAYVYFREKFALLQEVDELSEWIQKFYSSEISYIVSATPPYLMFETRNDRGLGVSGLDIVKNWMLYAEEYWSGEDSPIESNPEEKWWNALTHMEQGDVYDEKALLGHLRTIIHGSSIGGSRKDASAFKRRYQISGLSDENGSNREEFKEFVAAMEWVAKAMKEIYQPYGEARIPNGTFDEHVNNRDMTGSQAAEALVNLINISCRMDRTGIANTIVILTYHYLSPEDWVRVLKFLEKMIFRVHLVGREDLGNLSSGGQDLGRYCNTFYNAVKNKDPTEAADYRHITVALNTLLGNLCTWTISKQNLSQLYQKIVQQSNRYNGGAWTRYLLYHWEMAGPQFTSPDIANLRLFSGALDWGDPERTHELFQIEHIAAKDGWQVPVPPNPRLAGFVAGESYWNEPFDNNEDTYDKWKNYLGNLVLSKRAPNIIYDNKPFRISNADGETEDVDEKRWKYINYPGLIDWYQVRAVGRTYIKWNKATIIDRQERIARWAIRYWKLPCGDDELPDLTAHKLDYLHEHSDEFKQGGRELGDPIENIHAPPDGEVVEVPGIPIIDRDGLEADYDADDIEYNEHEEYNPIREG